MDQINSAPAASAAGMAAARQFVIFFVDGEAFAVPLAEVMEIIRMPDVVRLPLSPASLEGLANLRGSVLPIISTRRLFGLADIAHDDATRVVILDRGRPVGIVVDRMANVVTVEPDQIEPASAADGTIGSDLLHGMIKRVADHGMVMVLDTGRLLSREFGALAAADGAGTGSGRLAAALAAGGEAAAGPARAERQSDEIQLVSFEVAGQEYALPIQSVQEIVQVPERITRVPKAASSIVGVMNLRNRLLPVASLRAMFALDHAELAEDNRVVVVSLGNGGASVGIVMDRIKEVLRVGRSAIDPVPALLATDADLKEITAICRLAEGKRLVSVLSAEAMFNRAEVQDALAEAGAEVEQTLARTGERGGETAGDEEQFVVFRVMNEEYGVAIESVQEIVRVPEDVASVPRTPSFIEGVINLRGAVIPLVDQRRRFGLPACARNDRQRIVVFTIRGVRTGFIVDSVSEVMRIPQAKIGPAPDMSEDQRRIIRRVANLPDAKRMILLLDIEQMLDGQEIQELRRQAA
jgi:purine-binding chemotaxis protein CheW